MRREGTTLRGPKTREQVEIDTLFKKLVRAKLHKFPIAGGKLDYVPTERGVYIIFNSAQKVLHVGSTPRAKEGVRQRLKGHLAGNSSFVDWYLGQANKKVRKFLFSFIIVPNTRAAALLEAYAIGSLCPAHIGGASFARGYRANSKAKRK